MLVCCMALALMLTTAFATEAAQSADRVTVLAVQTTGASELADELTSALAMVPALGVDYVVRYDDGHLSLCDLTAAQTYSERGAALDAWNAEFVKVRSRNASHHTLWNLMASLPADYAIDLAKVDVLWLPAYDLAEDQWQNVTPGLSQLTACGGTLRLFATSAVPQLSQKLASYTNTTVTAVSNPGFDVFDLLLTEAGYYHVSDDAAKAMMRRTELQPASALPGDSVVIDRCAEYNLAGHTYTCGSITVGFTDSAHVGMAVVPVPHAEAEPEAQVTVTVDNAEADENVSADEQTDAVPENVSASASTLINQTQSEVAEHSVQDELELVDALDRLLEEV